MSLTKNFILENNKKYKNLSDAYLGSPIGLIKWRFERLFKMKDLSFKMTVVENPEIEYIKSNKTNTTITWIGHATFLIQINGLNIITDPVWANRMGLEKRMVPPGIAISDLPEIDIVLISHNHFDHLDFNSIKSLKGNPRMYIPKGLCNLFLKNKLRNVEEVNWWDKKLFNQVEMTFIPTQHWSKRTLWDTNRSLWGGWVINKTDEDEKAICFIGDSGYFKEIRDIGTKFNIGYVLVPIGCYEPEWFMSGTHMTPEEGIKVYRELKADYFIPMHYEAFRMGDDTPKEALNRLEAEWKRCKIEMSALKTLNVGETIKVNH